MPTSTLIALATSSIQYTWDSVTGFLYTSGGLTFYIVLCIIFGIIMIGLTALGGLFKK